VRDDNDEHPEKQSYPRESIEFGMVIDDNDEHPEKQELPRDLTEFEIASENNDEQFLKHLSPMEATNFGIVNFCNWPQPSKQPSGKERIISGNSNVSIDWFKMMNSSFVILKFSTIPQNDFDYYFIQ
jgi:hypothetical protein